MKLPTLKLQNWQLSPLGLEGRDLFINSRVSLLDPDDREVEAVLSFVTGTDARFQAQLPNGTEKVYDNGNNILYIGAVVSEIDGFVNTGDLVVFTYDHVHRLIEN